MGFATIVTEPGEHRAARLAYTHGVLEMMMPLPEHESDKEMISDLIKVLLEELDMECWCLGSTTFQKPPEHGLEPDQCFYIQHEVAVRGKKRLDMTINPPPDLALEVDLPSRTHSNSPFHLWRIRCTLDIFSHALLCAGQNAPPGFRASK